MGSQVQLFFPAGLYTHTGQAVLRIMELVESIEQEISVYRPGSDLVRLHQLAVSRPVAVGGALADLLETALEWQKRTCGAFDPTMGPLSRLWGFRGRTPRLPLPEEIETARRCVGVHHLDWNPAMKTLRLLHPDCEVDFNGIGKGFAIEKMGELLRSMGIQQWVIHAGQSSVSAGTPVDGEDGWTIGISDPIRPRRRLATVRLHRQSLGTSGSARQVLVCGGRRYGHVLDPRSGWPAEHWSSATVVHDSAIASDVLSTALFVMSPDEIGAFGEQYPQVKYLLVGSGPGSPRILAANFGEGELSFPDEEPEGSPEKG